jgi:hypothetical protein
LPAFIDRSFPDRGLLTGDTTNAFQGFMIIADGDVLYNMDEWGLIAYASDGTMTTIAPNETSGSTNGTIIE